MKRATKLIVAIILFSSSTVSFNVSAQNNQPYPPQYGKPFTGVPDNRDVTMYQVNTRSFSKEGNFKGVTARLDSIKALGINVIYIMPYLSCRCVEGRKFAVCYKRLQCCG